MVIMNHSPFSATKQDGLSEVHELTNDYRRSLGLEPFIREPTLDATAQLQAQHIADIEDLTHDGDPPNNNVLDRAIAAGFDPQRVGENLAEMNSPNPKLPVDGWRNSPSHDENLKGDFQMDGYAMVKGANGLYYWAAAYGNSRSIEPNQSEENSEDNSDDENDDENEDQETQEDSTDDDEDNDQDQGNDEIFPELEGGSEDEDEDIGSPSGSSGGESPQSGGGNAMPMSMGGGRNIRTFSSGNIFQSQGESVGNIQGGGSSVPKHIKELIKRLLDLIERIHQDVTEEDDEEIDTDKIEEETEEAKDVGKELEEEIEE